MILQHPISILQIFIDGALDGLEFLKWSKIKMYAIKIENINQNILFILTTKLESE